MIGRKTTGCAGAVMSIQIRRGAEPSGRYSGAPGSSSNTTPPISTSSPGSKPALSSAVITPSRCEAALDVRQRLLVLEVVAGDQAVDDLAGDAELARPEALDLELARRAPGGRRGTRRARRPASSGTGSATGTRREQLDRELVEALAGSRTR